MRRSLSHLPRAGAHEANATWRIIQRDASAGTVASAQRREVESEAVVERGGKNPQKPWDKPLLTRSPRFVDRVHDMFGDRER